ncbi:hypothetical protein BD310DRAFT_960202 [Dichomitus squalens]|uniref:Uncharacterized protein n=1 Tax=Dichomitus squalens TaxID=114155 RepID=A0A4Q9PQB3_9APHY|nr:hypothetical protein BD310DRAFT_960202 [Dichomitus squalens]
MAASTSIPLKWRRKDYITSHTFDTIAGNSSSPNSISPATHSLGSTLPIPARESSPPELDSIPGASSATVITNDRESFSQPPERSGSPRLPLRYDKERIASALRTHSLREKVDRGVQTEPENENQDIHRSSSSHLPTLFGSDSTQFPLSDEKLAEVCNAVGRAFDRMVEKYNQREKKGMQLLTEPANKENAAPIKPLTTRRRSRYVTLGLPLRRSPRILGKK